MATYAIGDLQGCDDEFGALLDQLTFDSARDRLWLVGDLVNRGPASLAVLRRVVALGEAVTVVLGNHDLHLLARAAGVVAAKSSETLAEVLAAPDLAQLLDWLRHRPLVHRAEITTAAGPRQFFMSHAGLPPCWSPEQAAQLAGEVEVVLRNGDCPSLLAGMYGDTPDTWSDSLDGIPRLRLITNYLTRMRYTTPQGRLDLVTKAGPPTAGYGPWFDFLPTAVTASQTFIFGHWAALRGEVRRPGIHALDTGCVWGDRLRAMRLEDGALFHQNALHRNARRSAHQGSGR